jgi:hypothetical protein
MIFRNHIYISMSNYCIVECVLICLFIIHLQQRLCTYNIKKTQQNANNHFVLPAWCYGSYRFIIADWEWCKLLCTIDHCEPAQFYCMVDRITDIDQHANGIFRSAANILVAHMKKPALAALLLEKSIKSPVNNDDWRLYHALAYVYHILSKPEVALFYLDAMVALPCRSSAVLKQYSPQQPGYCFQWASRLRKEIEANWFIQ